MCLASCVTGDAHLSSSVAWSTRGSNFIDTRAMSCHAHRVLHASPCTRLPSVGQRKAVQSDSGVVIVGVPVTAVNAVD